MASDSSGSATGNPRNKVALKPGHSLMDWIRLGNSGVDLSGTAGAVLEVSPAQLAEHNKESDVWLCIRGAVYNVTRYLEFHPGGIEELMKGAGKDATSLFNKVHPWVNYESLLKKCLVGKLMNTVEEDIFSIPDSKGKKNGVAKLKLPSPSHTYSKIDWYQQKDYIALVLYCKYPKKEVVVVSEDNEVWVRVGEDGWAGWVCPEASCWPPLVTVGSSSVEVRLNKPAPGLWTLQTPTSPPPSGPQLATVLSLTPLLHNVFLIRLSLHKCHYHIPVGFHVLVTATIKGIVVSRNYTPVCGALGDKEPDLCLVVKRYPEGMLSSWLCSRCPGDPVSVTAQPCGFVPPELTPDSTLLLLAAGTGLTPMVRLTHWALHERPQTKVKLVFFNKAERDIIWREEFEKLETEYERFSCDHVLSEGGPTWSGARGWITLQMVQTYLPDLPPETPSPFYTCVCGPSAFTKLTEKYLQDLGYTNQNYYCFRG